MNYLILKEIITSILGNFSCPQCGNKSSESAIFIKKIEKNSLDLHYHCPTCQTDSFLAAKLGEIRPEFLQSEMGRTMLHQALSENKIPIVPQEKIISQEEIIQIEKILSAHPTVNDLINGQ